MTSEECNERAKACAASAAFAREGPTVPEFLSLAAQWRILAVNELFVGDLGDPIPNPTSPFAAKIAVSADPRRAKIDAQV